MHRSPVFFIFSFLILLISGYPQPSAAGSASQPGGNNRGDRIGYGGPFGLDGPFGPDHAICRIVGQAKCGEPEVEKSCPNMCKPAEDSALCQYMGKDKCIEKDETKHFWTVYYHCPISCQGHIRDLVLNSSRGVA